MTRFQQPVFSYDKGWKTLCLLLLFVAGLIFQPMLSARILKIEEDGNYVLVCTLQGLKRIPVTELETLATSGTAECPACTLNNLLAASAVDSSPALTFEPTVSAPAPTVADSGKTAVSIWAPRMRAPPSLFS